VVQQQTRLGRYLDRKGVERIGPCSAQYGFDKRRLLEFSLVEVLRLCVEIQGLLIRIGSYSTQSGFGERHALLEFGLAEVLQWSIEIQGLLAWIPATSAMFQAIVTMRSQSFWNDATIDGK
jgi:hypothetical protein